MINLENIKKGSILKGLLPDIDIRVKAVEQIGTDAIQIIYIDPSGNLKEQMLFRADESRIELVEEGQNWSFDAPGVNFKLAVEALRIQLAYLFDPMMAVHTSDVIPLPHQITAVYESMLPRQPLRFVLADDPGAGKTIMAGLLIRELLIRADSERILIVAPGSLVEQWQGELYTKFGIEFDIFSKEMVETSRSGNPFQERNQLLVRVDQLSRNEDYRQKLEVTDWDLVIVDEAHKLAASYFGDEIKKTMRYQLGELLGRITRHFLLMTATPHNGKEADFQLFMALLDSERFYGKFRDGVHKVDISDLMRRMVKEELLKFDGTPLFPERRAYTTNYELSSLEAELYTTVTEYVRNGMNRADTLDGQKKSAIGFALTMLQRRLASSPEAIYQSISRRRKKLENRLAEEKLLKRGRSSVFDFSETMKVDEEEINEAEDDMESNEYEEWSEKITSQATAAATIAELEHEIEELTALEEMAKRVVHAGTDSKWIEMSRLLQDTPEMKATSGNMRKLIIFTEYKDTLNYLYDRIGTLLGNPNSVCMIHGGVNRDDRTKIQEEFRNNKDITILLATDAAGEGVNLQCANLMINYDLPWNPNRLEQRFGRIHRIGQEEVCHLWNMVAPQTREGDVFKRLLDKLEVEREALGGRVFDILGDAFEDRPLKDLLIEAIRYGESPEVRERLNRVIEGVLDTEHLKKIMEQNALCEEHMSIEQLYKVKEDMEKAEARKLQPFYVRSFFKEAFEGLKGQMKEREKNRFEITHVPAVIRDRDRITSISRTPVLTKYERICFEKELKQLHGKPMAEFVHPGHPLMHAVTDIVLSENRNWLRKGAVLVDPADESAEPRFIGLLDHRIKESVRGKERDVSRRLQFVSIDENGTISNAGYAPYLDLKPADKTVLAMIQPLIKKDWLQKDIEQKALAYAGAKIAPEHFTEIKERRERHINKTLAAVQERLVKEINYWQDRLLKLTEDVKAGKQPRLQPDNAKKKIEEMKARLERRKKELEEMRNITSATPQVIGGALVIPQGLIDRLSGSTTIQPDAEARRKVERLAMNAVMKAEEALGHTVRDVSKEKCGWDITSYAPAPEGQLHTIRHIEVKGRDKSQSTITISRNEVLYALNQRDKFILAIVIVDGDIIEGPYYIRDPFTQEPEIGEASKNILVESLLGRSQKPEESI